MRISVIGCGYLGAVHAVAMASLGHEVVAVDIDERKVRTLAAGEAPFHEPGLQEVLREALNAGRLRFTTDFAEVKGAEVHFIGVGTPQRVGADAADLSQLHAALNALLPHVSKGEIVAGKSTVPVGTAESLSEQVAVTGATLVWNPEFLREGRAVQDSTSPDRVVLGVSSADSAEEVRAIFQRVFHPSAAKNIPFIVTDYATAELVKGAANAFLATKISFINAMAELAEVTGADVTQLADAIGHDARIGRSFLDAGVGFGGGCLPKDIRAFSARAEELGRPESVAFLREVDKINLRRRDRVVQLLVESFDGKVAHKRVTVLGAAFKPGSDDIRDSPALDIAARLHSLGAVVTVTDPAALANAQRVHPQLRYVARRDSALRGAHAVIVATDWEEYRQLSPRHAAAFMASCIIIDARNCLDPAAWDAEGWLYRGLGRH